MVAVPRVLSAVALIVSSLCLLLLGAPVAGAAGWRLAATRVSGQVRLVSGCLSTDANTPQIAVDPTNARHLATTYAVGGGTGSVLAVTRDGGRTWRRSPIAGTVACDGGGGTYDNRFDPDLEFDPWGRLWVSESVEQPFGASGTTGIDVFSLTVAPGSTKLGPATPIVAADPLVGAQRGFFAFDRATPDAADVLTVRDKFVDGQYDQSRDFLQIARTGNGSGPSSTRTVYTTSPGNLVVAEGLIRHRKELLAFGDVGPSAAKHGVNRSASMIMLRSSDGGGTWSSPERVFLHSEIGADHVSDCCLLRPVSGPDGTIYIPHPSGGKLQLVRSTDEGRAWQQLTIGSFGDVSEPVVAAGPHGRVAVAFYKITKTTSGLAAAVLIAVSDNRGQSWKLLKLGKPFSISSLGPTTDTSPLGPVQGIAATPTGFVAAMTVGGSLVPAGTGSVIDLVTIAKPSGH